jgi:hypothetical protein
VPDGQHLVSALVHQSSGAILEVRRQITVDNPNIAVSLTSPYKSQNTNWVELNAVATADAGIHSVEFFVNGASVHVDTASPYNYTLSAVGLPAGANLFKVIATDNAGDTAEATLQLMVDNWPTLTVTEPTQSIITGGTLRVRGNLADDQPGATLKVSLGNVPILESSTPGQFSVDYSLAGLPPGTYTLTLEAFDAAQHYTRQRLHLRIESDQFTYELVASGVRRAIATSNGALLYQRFNYDVVLRNANGSEVVLQLPAGASSDGNWQLSGGRAVLGSDQRVYVFDSTGHATDFSAQFGTTNNVGPLLKYPWLMWRAIVNGQTRGEIHNLDTQARFTVPGPIDLSISSDPGYDLVTTPGAEKFLFWAYTTGAAGAKQSDIFNFDLAAATTQPVTSGGSHQRDVQTDNVRFAWKKAAAANSATWELLAAPVSNASAVATLSANANWFKLRDGQLFWTEPFANSTSGVLKVNDGTTTVQISSNASTYGLFASDGRVTFYENGKLMVWSSGAGKQVLLNSLPTSYPIHDDGIAFFTTLFDRANDSGINIPFDLYRVQLP